ncbi:MAG: rod shape-determining protein MreD [Candidatus Margulisbacteria bacterium]|nr:rod shape-determining protein MreD [Candidatus Margulisiibacteriota bacterium]
MRFFKIIIFIILVLVLQTVFFARLNLFGVAPDLILVSVILFAVYANYQQTLLVAVVAGFLQDILSYQGYANTIVNVSATYLINLLKHNYIGGEQWLCFNLVLALSPLSQLIQRLPLRQTDPWLIVKVVFLGTLYNLMTALILAPIVKRLAHGE